MARRVPGVEGPHLRRRKCQHDDAHAAPYCQRRVITGGKHVGFIKRGVRMQSTGRRNFLKVIAVSAAAATVPAGRVLAAMAAEAITVSRLRFPQSVASGDPRPDRVLLWTRVAADADGARPVRLRLQVAEDAGFTALRVDRDVAVPADSDGCIKVRVAGLDAGSRYHYRFLLDDGGGFVSSPYGRTRTAPAADADVPLRFAFLSCQDFGGRWYNSLLPLLDQDLDFVLHLGDFIYETVGDPSFQETSGERRIVFDDARGALALGEGAGRYFAARSLSNYRQVHRSFRSDEALQALLEHAPLVAIWDDHEFSDDCWQDVGTYRDGAGDERDRERRRNAEQAYLEYMPVDLDSGGGDGLPVERGRLHPNLSLWRELRFGRALQLLLTDYRSARPDHPIPEDAFPGQVVYDRPALEARLPKLGMDYARLAPSLMPYVDLARDEHAPLREALRAVVTGAYVAAGQAQVDAVERARAATSGLMALPVVERFLAGYNSAAPAERQLQAPDAASLDRGLAWLGLGKTALFGSMGSRYMVVKDSYDLFAALRALDGAPSAYGAEQRDWLATRLQAPDARFRVVASSVSFTSLVLDLRDEAIGAPAAMRHRFYLNVDHWDGFPVERDQLLREVFDPAGGVILLSGDIHAGFATQHSAATVEFTTPAVSSEPLKGMIARTVQGDDPAVRAAGERMVANLDAMFTAAFSPMRYAQSGRHGASVLAIDGDHVTVEFLELPADACRQRLYDDRAAVQARLRRQRFSVDRQTMTLRPQPDGR